jgi:hypothetical protein
MVLVEFCITVVGASHETGAQHFGTCYRCAISQIAWWHSGVVALSERASELFPISSGCASEIAKCEVVTYRL